jgi:ABC-type transport system involved in resistance to organic solvents, ATPase component
MAEPYSLEIRDLHTSIKDHVIHQGLSMQVLQGEIFGIVGGSGSGKTVLLNSILGLMQPQSGEIKIFGEPSEVVHNSFAYKKRMGILFQRGALFSSLNVLQNICVPMIEQGGLSEEDAKEIAYVKLQIVGLDAAAAEKLPEELSGGMIKRVALARTLALDANLVFLDEPTSGLDPIAAEAFDQLILKLKQRLGLTVIMITHDLGSLAICDHIGVILDKKMITGTLEEIQQNPHPWVQEYFSGARSQALKREKTVEEIK